MYLEFFTVRQNLFFGTFNASTRLAGFLFLNLKIFLQPNSWISESLQAIYFLNKKNDQLFWITFP